MQGQSLTSARPLSGGSKLAAAKRRSASGAKPLLIKKRDCLARSSRLSGGHPNRRNQTAWARANSLDVAGSSAS